jgi:hypothetical protein
LQDKENEHASETISSTRTTTMITIGKPAAASRCRLDVAGIAKGESAMPARIMHVKV